jgi:hypothetical protein
MASPLRIKIRATQALRIGLDEVAAGSIIDVEPSHAAQLIRARRAKLLDFSDLHILLKATERPATSADICAPFVRATETGNA